MDYRMFCEGCRLLAALRFRGFVANSWGGCGMQGLDRFKTQRDSRKTSGARITHTKPAIWKKGHL